MAVKLSPAELRAWQALLHAHHEVNRRLDSELRRDHGVSLADYDVLLRLANAPDGRLRMTELAARVLVSPSTLTRRVDGLVRDGLVERRRLEGDSRVLLASLTHAGRGLLRRAAVTHLQGIRRHFSGRLSGKQLKAVGSALEVIAGRHEPH
jgi:DNA-binding MarR family transcriptional regulator